MIFILGLDGLELNLVEKWDLKNLKQKEYGKLEVPISKRLGVPASPEVWASFLTGRHVRGKAFSKPLQIEIPLRILRFMRSHINLSLGLGKRLANRGASRFPKLEYKTFFDHIDKTKALNVPYINHDHAALNAIHKFKRQGGITLEEAIKRLENIYENRKKQILSEMDKIKDEKLIFSFIHFPDSLQHFLLFRPKQIREHYFDLDNFVFTLKKKLKKSTTFIIISDHGFDLELKTHSKYGFYSSNIPLNPKPVRITDFFTLLVNKANEECTDEDTDASGEYRSKIL